MAVVLCCFVRIKIADKLMDEYQQDIPAGHTLSLFGLEYKRGRHLLLSSHRKVTLTWLKTKVSISNCYIRHSSDFASNYFKTDNQHCL